MSKVKEDFTIGGLAAAKAARLAIRLGATDEECAAIIDESTNAKQLVDALEGCARWIDDYFVDKGSSGLASLEYCKATVALRKARG